MRASKCVVPPRARPREIEQFIAAHREWIDSRRAIALAQSPGAAAVSACQASSCGCRRGAGGCTWPASAGAVRVLEAGAGNPAGNGRRRRASELRASLRTWLLRAARARLAPRVAALAAAMGVKYSQVSIRRQRSRWGSCSARGTISLNCCLLFQRPEVVDYLIVHELMHVKHMNHSARFWQAVERHCADWRALDRELVQGWRHVPRWVFSNE